VEDFEKRLKEVSECIEKIRKHALPISILTRQEYRNDLCELGLHIDNIRIIIENLTVEDYYRGPSKPDD
jgi:hypothetical protein